MEYNFEVIRDEDFNEDKITICPKSVISEVKKNYEKIFNPIFTKMNVFDFKNIGYVMGMCQEFEPKSFTDFFERVYLNESLNHSEKSYRGKSKKEIYNTVCDMKKYAEKNGIGNIPLHIYYIYFFDVAFNRTTNGYFRECSFDKEAEESGKYKAIKTKSPTDDSRKGIDSILEAVSDDAITHVAQLKPFTFVKANDNPKLIKTRKSFFKKSKESKYPFYIYLYKKDDGYMVNDKYDSSYPNICCFKVEDLYDEDGFVKEIEPKIYEIDKKDVIKKIPF